MSLKKYFVLCFFLFGSLVVFSQNINTATNGLTKTGNTVSLGGTLTTNTAIDLGSSFTFRLSKSTQDLLKVINNGNVGIGIAAPVYKLDVNGAIRIGTFSVDPAGNNGALYYRSSLNKLRGYVNGGWKNFLMEGDAGTVTSITAGYGLLGGTITNSGTMRADSATLANYFIRKKDTLAATTGYATLYQNSLKQNKLFLTTDGTSGAASLVGSTLNIPSYTTGSTWGSITGTLSSQTDLQTSLNAKQNNLTLTTTGPSGTATLVGSTLNIPSYTYESTWGSITGTLSSQTDLQTSLNAKQSNLALTTTGTSGLATLVGSTLNIPSYSSNTSSLQAVTDVGNSTTNVIVSQKLDGGLTYMRAADNSGGGAEIAANGAGLGYINLYNSSGGIAQILPTNLTAIRQFQLPNASGTIALTSDISSGGGTVTSITAGYGLLGGNIINTGTISADSATLANYFMRKIDSVNFITGYSTLYQNSLKQDKLTLTTTGTSGAPSLVGSALNIPSFESTWGSITGTLSSQTDLQTYLNAKQNKLTLTTTGTSGAATLIGSTLNIPSYTNGSTWGLITGTLSSQTDLQTSLNTKQNNLTLTTTGTSGVATLVGSALNIPSYGNDSTFAKNDLTATGNRTHNWNYKDFILKNARNASFISDNIYFKTREFVNIQYGVLIGGVTYTGALIQYGKDSIAPYSDAKDSNDQTDLNSGSYGYVLQGINRLIIEKRYTFDSLQFFTPTLQSTGSNTFYINYSFGGISASAPATAVLHDKYLNTYTPIPRGGSTIINYIIDVNAASRGQRFTLNFKPLVRGLSHIVANPDTLIGKVAYNMVTFDNDTLKLASIPTGGGTTTINNDADNRLTTALGNGQFNAENNLTFDGSTFSVNGNIGIGTAATNGYRLAVNGNSIFTRLKVREYALWPDYVFESNYKLPSLTEVEKFIKQHKHLPEVPSKEDVKKEGLDIGDNQTLLLKKIEELTLYVIEQNKKVEVLQLEVQNLKNDNAKNK